MFKSKIGGVENDKVFFFFFIINSKFYKINVIRNRKKMKM